jgi:hypothetical protein
MAQIAMDMARSNQGLNPLITLMTTRLRELDVQVSGLTGNLSAQTEKSGISMPRLALAEGVDAGGQPQSPPV